MSEYQKKKKSKIDNIATEKKKKNVFDFCRYFNVCTYDVLYMAK